MNELFYTLGACVDPVKAVVIFVIEKYIKSEIMKSIAIIIFSIVLTIVIFNGNSYIDSSTEYFTRLLFHTLIACFLWSFLIKGIRKLIKPPADK